MFKTRNVEVTSGQPANVQFVEKYVSIPERIGLTKNDIVNSLGAVQSRREELQRQASVIQGQIAMLEQHERFLVAAHADLPGPSAHG